MNTNTQLNPYNVACSYPQVCQTISDVLLRMGSAGVGHKEVYWTKCWIESLKRFCKQRGSVGISRQSGLDFLAQMRSSVAPDDAKGLWRINQATNALRWLFVLTGKGCRGAAGAGADHRRVTQGVNTLRQGCKPSDISDRGVGRVVNASTPMAAPLCLDDREPTRGWGRARVEPESGQPEAPVGNANGEPGSSSSAAPEADPQDKAGLIIPAEITIYQDRSFTFILKSPPAAVLQPANACTRCLSPRRSSSRPRAASR